MKRILDQNSENCNGFAVENAVNSATEKVMTVGKVAEVLGVSSEAIKKHIREMFPECIKNGVTTYLNEYQVTLIKERMRPTTKVVGAKTELEMKKKAAEVIQWYMDSYEAERQARIMAENTIREQKPKVEFYDSVTGSSDTIDMKEVAKVLNIPGLGRNKLFELLRYRRILDDRNQPYQRFVDAGMFRVIESKYTDGNGDTHINLKTVVFQKGVDYIRKIVNQ